MHVLTVAASSSLVGSSVDDGSSENELSSSPSAATKSCTSMSNVTSVERVCDHMCVHTGYDIPSVLALYDNAAEECALRDSGYFWLCQVHPVVA